MTAAKQYFSFKAEQDLLDRIASLGLSDALGLSQVSHVSHPLNKGGLRLANRFVAHPMEGWDADGESGQPTESLIRRWERMGSSGAALIWGVEAMAVDFEYRANKRQLVLRPENTDAIADALKKMRAAAPGPVFVGAQVTCSGRYSYGRSPQTPVALVYHHPALDGRLGCDANSPLMSDAQMEDLVGMYVKSARVARDAGFDFIDIKACHRYWLNETLAAKNRPGKYGGSFENRTKIFLMIVDAIQAELGKDFPLGTRMSAYDGLPFEAAEDGRGRPAKYETPYLWGWGVDETDPHKEDLSEPLRLAKILFDRGLRLFNVTAASPYSNPHLSRPTDTPPVDGYLPYRDPLLEVARHSTFAAAFTRELPEAVIVGTGYSYLQDYKLGAANWALANRRCDMVGVGRALLSYPDELQQLLSTGKAVKGRGRIVCNGNSSCTTGPRLGLVSGCIFDPYYRDNQRDIQRLLKEKGLSPKK